MSLWICGQHFESKDQPNRCWEFQGVFDDEDKAIAACSENSFFIFPAELNEPLPTETLQPAGAYYPRLETKEQARARLGC
jgi:hypothetical protein